MKILENLQQRTALQSQSLAYAGRSYLGCCCIVVSVEALSKEQPMSKIANFLYEV